MDQQISSYLLSLQKDHRHPKRELLQTVFKDILPKNMIWETQDAYEEGVVHWIGKLQDALDGKVYIYLYVLFLKCLPHLKINMPNQVYYLTYCKMDKLCICSRSCK